MSSAVLLHGLVWLVWRNPPITAPAQIPRVVEVALISQPKAKPARPAAPKPATKPVPPKPKPLPKPTAKPLPKPTTPQPAEEKPVTAAPPADVAPSAPAAAPFKEANYKAAYLQNPPPRYPPMARERHWEGKVLIRTKILADGSAGEVRIEQSSGHEALDAAALDAVKNWRFVAAMAGDQAVDSWVIIPIDFKLKN